MNARQIAGIAAVIMFAEREWSRHKPKSHPDAARVFETWLKDARAGLAQARKEARLAAIDRRIVKETGKSLLQRVPAPKDGG